MQVVELSEFRDEEGEISLENRIRGILSSGRLGWYSDMQAQESVTRRMNRVLGSDHTMLRNIPIYGTEHVAPMILLSPQGARLLYLTGARGIFRAKGDDWLSYSSRAEKFKKTRPNLQAQAQTLAEAVRRSLEQLGYPLPNVEAVLLFTNPRTHVDSAMPNTRIVLADAVDHFAANLLEQQPIMDQEDIRILQEALVNPQPKTVEEPAQDFQEIEPAELESAPLSPDDPQYAEEGLKPLEMRPGLKRRRGKITRRQWVILGVLGLLEVGVIVVFVLIILSDMLII
jgi:hypothetical protein